MRWGHRFAPENMSLFRAIVEQADDAIIFADRGEVIRLWNRGAEILFGYCAAEVVGRHLDVIVPERFRHAHSEGFGKAMLSGQTKYGGRVMTTRSTHKSGSSLYVDLRFGLLKDDAGQVTGAFAIGRDCTAQHLAKVARGAHADAPSA